MVCGLAVGALAAWWRNTRPLFDSTVAAGTCLSLILAPSASTRDHLLLLFVAAVLLEHYAHRMAPSGRALALGALAVVFVGAPWVVQGVAMLRGDEALSVVIPAAALVLVLVAEQRTRAGRGSSLAGEGAIRIG